MESEPQDLFGDTPEDASSKDTASSGDATNGQVPGGDGASFRPPLAARMRPRNLDEFVGQEHFCAPGKLLWRLLKAGNLSSAVFYGPPGCGKTSLAQVIANTLQAEFHSLNAVSSNVRELRVVLDIAKRRASRKRRTVLFIDEIHRFNRAQQDVLLPDVEQGIVILVGATVHNPFFTINSPLLSRSQIFEFRALRPEHVMTLLRRALADRERGLGDINIDARDDALAHIIEVCDGDARRCLNALEVGVMSSAPDAAGRIVFDLACAEESIQRKAVRYDRADDMHYDVASAFIKSMRGSDPDAALYWLAKMLEGGEDPRFIARRIVICASEDVGNAAPNALVLAVAALNSVEFVGMPEARIPLAQAVTYIACSPKSNAAYLGVEKALEDVRAGHEMPVPEHLRDANYPGSKRLGHGEGYKYAHDFGDHWVDQDYIPEERLYYEPTEYGHERELKRRLDEIRARRRAAREARERKEGDK
ncbi:MAG TPA: replication-associated recombination protein A [Candidatus Brocadiia bacterium]|nr:replication-associated recombination protein A [Candidatus Brocadiia bacterium]